MGHTPKPWEVISLSGIGGSYAIKMNWNGQKTYYGVQGIHREADACLISAAPEMYEALRNLENDNGAIPDHAWKMVKNAINKAEGKNDSQT